MVVPAPCYEVNLNEWKENILKRNAWSSLKKMYIKVFPYPTFVVIIKFPAGVSISPSVERGEGQLEAASRIQGDTLPGSVLHTGIVTSCYQIDVF